MVLSDLSVRRPVVCTVGALILVIVGTLQFSDMPVRLYPHVDRPVVAVETSYTGASAQVVETQITEPLEKEISAAEGIHLIRSSSDDQVSRILVEFDLNRDIDQAANDVRDRVSRVQLPQEVDPPQVTKSDPDASPVMTLQFHSEVYSRLDIVELVERLVVPRLQTVEGVGAVRIDGPRYAMRLWIDGDRLAAHGVTVDDVEQALREQNIEIPSGRIESNAREFPLRLLGNMALASEFENLVLSASGARQVRFKDVGWVQLGAEEYRSDTAFNGKPAVGVRVLRQSQANVLDLIGGVKQLLPGFRQDLPAGIDVQVSKDDSVYVDRSVRAVQRTLFEAVGLVVLVIFVFLRDWRATLVPLIAIPVSVIGAIAFIAALGFSINVLTMLACVLAIGLVVDDAIIMLENIYRRIEQGTPPLYAAILGARQVAFAIIATTLTLVAVFVPVAFQSGQIGRLFYEFGMTLVAAVAVSSVVALSVTPMLCARVLKAPAAGARGWLHQRSERGFVILTRGFAKLLEMAMQRRALVLISAAGFVGLGVFLYGQLPRELVPTEDRGILTATINPPVGVTPEYVRHYTRDVERIISELPELDRSFSRLSDRRSYVTATLVNWEDRSRSTQAVIRDLRTRLQQAVTGVQVSVATARPFGGIGGRSGAGAVELVLQGGDFSALQNAAEQIQRLARAHPSFGQVRVEPSPTKPQLDVRIDRTRAADLGVPVSAIATALETMLGSRRVTQFQRGNQQYDVILQVADADRMQPGDLARVHVRAAAGHLVQLSSLLNWDENAVPESYPHFNRLRGVTVTAQLADAVPIGEGIEVLSGLARQALPGGYGFAWDGQAREFMEGTSDTTMLFGLALLFTFLILAAQFESWIHPLTIFTGVLLALASGIAVLYCSRFWGPPMTDNLFSRFGLIMLIGLVAKNGILIVEFANQLRIQGNLSAADAARQAVTLRFRPILMTSLSTVLGAVPIALSAGAGAEIRNPLGLVVVGGLALSTLMTLFVVPLAYVLMDRLCLALTGRSSEAGLKQAAEVERQLRAQADGRVNEPGEGPGAEPRAAD